MAIDMPTQDGHDLGFITGADSMKRDYLGDSYDCVKRLWREVLSSWAPLFAEPRFLPQELRADFTLLTGIPILTSERPSVYSILNDPDTGIRLPNEAIQIEGRKHVSIATIIKQLREPSLRCVVTFDQSDYRKQKRPEQRRAKMEFLRENGVPAFYYVSHAPFLFAFPNIKTLRELRDHLIAAGIPTNRLEMDQPGANQ